MKFEVLGYLVFQKEKRKFKKTVDAPTENGAKERVYTLFGSYNRVKRRNVVVEKIELVK
ncbi:MAG TPA: 50S ribosomal protein L18Ae [Candidatus Bilamarchaeaceae archaeon]|nr:50S ribosomal protein L18Ae [Candidatus Bilamarchaeaceae archaeon]